MLYDLTDNQKDYIIKYMREHLELTREGIREYCRDGFYIPEEDIQDLNTLKGILLNLKGDELYDVQ